MMHTPLTEQIAKEYLKRAKAVLESYPNTTPKLETQAEVVSAALLLAVLES